MKKIIFVLLLLIISILLLGCSTTKKENEKNYENDEKAPTSVVPESSEQEPSPSVPYHENDWCGIDWEKLEFPVDVSDMEWSQNHAPLSSKDDALILGQAILSEFQKNERCLNYNLCVIVHSTEDNIWRFDYAPKQESAPVHVGELMCVAVDGTTGKPIAAWVEE
ncbi:MAG: hypothetical protein IJC46_06875 [Clostridia bacterium]|nr:hypothetical protein [Clostridia bacterium]